MLPGLNVPFSQTQPPQHTDLVGVRRVYFTKLKRGAREFMNLRNVVCNVIRYSLKSYDWINGSQGNVF